jgi:hypothetical protein
MRVHVGLLLAVAALVRSDAFKGSGNGGLTSRAALRNDHSVLQKQEVEQQKRRRGSFGLVSLSAAASAARTGGRDLRTVPPYSFSKQQFVYVVLTSIFVTCLIVADVIGVKIFELTLPFTILGFKTVEHTCGMLTFPVTFLLGDIINEYYGAKATRTTVYIGLAMSIFVFGMMNIAQALPYLDKPFNVSPQAFNTIFGSAKLMYIASIAAYLVGQLIDIWLFGVIKRITKGKYLWLRATGSTLISQLLDSFVVSYIAFGPGKTLAGQAGASVREVLNIALTGYGLKFVISGLITPVLYWLRDIMHNVYELEPLPVDYDEEERAPSF